VEITAPAKIRPSPIFGMSRATALGALKQNDNRKKRRSLVSTGASETDLKQCADRNLGTKFRKRGNPLYLAVLIGRTKSTLNYAISRLFTHGHFLLSAPTAVRVHPSTLTLFAFSRRGPMRSFAFGTWPSHALHQVRQRGRAKVKRQLAAGRRRHDRRSSRREGAPGSAIPTCMRSRLSSRRQS
jgi:hypothetical protein